MNCNQRVGLGFAMMLCAVACDVDSGVTAHDAGNDAANDMIVNADNNPFPCLNPVPYPMLGEGVLQCASGQYIRPRVPDCPASGNPMGDACRNPDDCTGGDVCFCGSIDSLTGNTCGQRSNTEDCWDSAECEPGFHCAYVTIGRSDWAIWHLRCQTPLDECAVNADCVPEGADAGFLNTLQDPLCQADLQGRVCCDPDTGSCER